MTLAIGVHIIRLLALSHQCSVKIKLERLSLTSFNYSSQKLMLRLVEAYSKSVFK